MYTVKDYKGMLENWLCKQSDYPFHIYYNETTQDIILMYEYKVIREFKQTLYIPIQYSGYYVKVVAF